MEKLLIVDDSADIRKQLKWGLGKEYEILQAGDLEEALKVFQAHRPAVVTLDLGLPPDADGATEGLRCLEEMLRLRPQSKVIVLSGNEERANALRAVALGAYDFYQKPIELVELKIILRRAFHLASLEEEHRRLQQANSSQAGLHGIFGQCPEIEEVFTTIRKVASTDVPVMILGENGTGKEMVARAIHELSLRKDGPFIPINCGAIPENLLEAELFGHEKGAFTGAAARVQGKVEFAHGGTLFLDEIGEMPAALQVKLLRFLQEKLIQRVGGREDILVDARIVAATNVDIAKAIAQGEFREDLYYRISVITVSLPPLRERGADVVLLANLFLRRFGSEFNKRVRGFSSEALHSLNSYHWPGNVRELENKVKRAVVMSDAPIIEPADLGFRETPVVAGAGSVVGSESHGVDFSKLSLKDARNLVERDMVTETIGKLEGNIARAAEALGVSRPTLYDLMKKHGLHVS